MPLLSQSRPPTLSRSPPHRPLQAKGMLAALGHKLSRRRPSFRQPPAPLIVDEVIDITARKRDEEVQERNRLRAEAAQAIGLDPLLVDQDVCSHRADTEDYEDHEWAHVRSESAMSFVEHPINPRASMHPPHTPPPPDSVLRSKSPSPIPPVGRLRSASFAGGHSRNSSVNSGPTPPYPSTVSALSPWQQHASSLPKYYPPSSLRIFALSNAKNWKPRYIVLTSPAAPMTRTRSPSVSYLHLFKDSGSNERELERLAINEDSVVFVSDDEVGGRRDVIKIGGIEAGAFKKDLNVEDSGRTMWFLQIRDPAESRQWISAIKTSIYNQRAIRAGLLPAANAGFAINEPRGDIDVMLSMRAQGFISTPITPKLRHSTPPAVGESNSASSISDHSVRSQASSPKGPAVVSTIKGLFSASRPRSGSRGPSIETTRLYHHQAPDQNEDKDTAKLRSSTPDRQSQLSEVTANPAFLSSISPEVGIDRKIVPDPKFTTNEPPSSPFSSMNRGAKTLSLGSISLQPPPRKRWTSSIVVSPPSSTSNQLGPEVYHNAHYNDTATSLGALTYYRDGQEPGSPAQTTASVAGTVDSTQVRPTSIYSVSTYASNENSLNVERSNTSISTKRTSSSTRRWSRQSSLPPITSPPPGPLPNPPGSVSRSVSATEGTRSNDLTSASTQRSVASSLPSFSKRASMSSAPTTSPSSFSSISPITRHRASMPPPPRPEPTSALPPAPRERPNNRPLSIDSMPQPNRSPTKWKRVSRAGKNFRLSMIAPSKPPPSTNLPPRPDETVWNKPPSSRRFSAGNVRLLRLNPIPASPDPSAAPFPPPLGPLPPLPLTSAENPPNPPGPNANQPSTGGTLTKHASLKQRLRILSAPSSPHIPGNNNANIDSDSTPAKSKTLGLSSSSPSRLSSSAINHHKRTSSADIPSSHSDRHQFSFKNRKSVFVPLAYTPSYLCMTNTQSQPATPIGEKILSLSEESDVVNSEINFDNFTFSSSATAPAPSLLSSSSISKPIRSLPVVPFVPDVTPLSPPPRRNSKPIIMIPSPPRTPSTPSVYEEKHQSEESKTHHPSRTLPMLPTDTFGCSTNVYSSSVPPKSLSPVLSIPPSPSLHPVSEGIDSPSQDSDGGFPLTPESPSRDTLFPPASPASVTSFGPLSL